MTWQDVLLYFIAENPMYEKTHSLAFLVTHGILTNSLKKTPEYEDSATEYIYSLKNPDPEKRAFTVNNIVSFRREKDGDLSINVYGRDYRQNNQYNVFCYNEDWFNRMRKIHSGNNNSEKNLLPIGIWDTINKNDRLKSEKDKELLSTINDIVSLKMNRIIKALNSTYQEFAPDRKDFKERGFFPYTEDTLTAMMGKIVSDPSLGIEKMLKDKIPELALQTNLSLFSDVFEEADESLIVKF